LLASQFVKLALLVSISVSLWAIEPRLPEIRIEPKVGGWVVYIRNPTAQPLTAVCLAAVEHPFWEDEIREPIPPNGEKRIEFDHPGAVTVQAAIYADGTTAGDTKIVGQFLETRRFTLNTARDLVKTLQKAQKLNTPKATVAGDLKIQADTLRLQPIGEASRDLILRTISQLEGTKSYSDVLLDLLKEESNIATSRPSV
jgi:hypothetical protein